MGQFETAKEATPRNLQFTALQETHTFSPRLLNQARIGFNFIRNRDVGTDVGNVGRTFARGPAFYGYDCSLRKRFVLWESAATEFRADLLNVFNHPIRSNPIGDLGAGTDFGPHCRIRYQPKNHPTLAEGCLLAQRESQRS
jgi:hypothetical protein